MPMDINAELTIDAEPGRVAAYAMDPRHDPIWISGISEAEQLSEGPLRLGTTVRRAASFLGRRIDYVLVVAELEPGRFIRMKSVKGPFPMDVSYSFEPEGGATRARIHIGGDASPMYRVAAPLLDRAARRGISKDLRNLKRIMEAEG
jgi:hypothetical protein